MSRSRTRKKTPQNNVDKKQETQVQDYAKTFAHNSNNTLTAFLQNPFLQNELLKNINMNPSKFDRDKVEELIRNPAKNEDALRALSQYLENFIMHFKRLVHYYGTILVHDNYLEPTNADEEDMLTSPFKKSHKRALEWLDKFDVKGTLTNVMKNVMLEDAKYYYVRESESAITLQEMPSNWCKIVRKTDLGYQYAFNMTYFFQTGMNFDDYAPEFKDYYDNYHEYKDSNVKHPFPDVTIENINGKYYYWQDLDPVKAPVFKWEDSKAGVVPPFIGLFIDSIEIATYKELLKTKTKLEVWKILLNKIPLHNDGKGTQSKNNYAIDAVDAGKFNALVQGAVPEGVKSITTPFESDAIDFDQSQSKNSIAGIGEDAFYRSAGTSPMMFGEKNTNGTGLEASIKTDEAWVDFMYRQFERFINYQLKQTTGKYRFKIHLEGTRFDRKDRFERAFKAATSGAPKTYLAVAMGKTPSEFINLSNFENSMSMIEKMKPLISSHTQSDGGAPNKNQTDLGESGVKSKDNGSNQNG